MSRTRIAFAFISSFILHDFVQYRLDVDPHRAGADTPAAAGAERLAELVVIVLELVHDPVAVAGGLQVPGVMPGGVVGELAEAAGVPALSPAPLLFRSLVNNVETVARRAEEGAGAAAGAARRFP